MSALLAIPVPWLGGTPVAHALVGFAGVAMGMAFLCLGVWIGLRRMHE